MKTLQIDDKNKIVCGYWVTDRKHFTIIQKVQIKKTYDVLRFNNGVWPCGFKNGMRDMKIGLNRLDSIS